VLQKIFYLWNNLYRMNSIIKKTGKILIIITLVSPIHGEPALSDWVAGKIMVSEQSSIITDNNGNPLDIETGSVISIAEAGTRAFGRAKDAAFISAVNILKKMRIDNETTLHELIGNDEIVRQRFSVFLDSKVKYKEVYLDYLTRGINLEIKTGDLLRVINYEFPQREFPLRNDMNISTLYTSLVIDARGLNIKPMLLPVIYNENGLEVYSKDFISADEAVKHNAVAYVYNEKDGIRHKKAGKRPYFCVALKSLNGSPVISDDDIKRVFSDKKNLDYLRKCRVVFILDRYVE